MKKLFLLVLFLVGLGFAIANFPGLSAQGKYSSIVLDFRESLSTSDIEQRVDAIATQYSVEVDYNSEFSKSDHIFVLKGQEELLNKLRASDLKELTEFIEPNYLYQASRAPNDPDYSKQWNMRSINVESAWERTRGRGTTVAVIDTGISTVPDLKQTRLVPGYDFVNDRASADDDHGHGTHVAGTVAQSTNNGFGVSGIAYEAQLMPLKVLSRQGGGTVSDIAEAIRFAADHKADVINMSLGGGGESKLMREAIEYAHKKGVVIVAAAGNAGRNAAEYPARYPHVIGVSALDSVGNKAPYSNFGAGVDIAAPGGSIQDRNGTGGILQNTITPQGDSVFAAFQGTSMAAPHVAGVAALIRSSGIQNPDQVEKILQQSALPSPGDSANHFGAGKLDAAAAVVLSAQKSFGLGGLLAWLRNGLFFGSRIWFDAGAINWGLKLGTLGLACLIAWSWRSLLPSPWNSSLLMGLNLGSVGFFLLRGLYFVDLPQWPLRVLGSSIPELGGALQGTIVLNPLFANALIPLFLIALLLSHPQWKWFAIGSAIGVTACLAVSAVVFPGVLWISNPILARGYLGVNALFCFAVARLAAKSPAS
ncbi:Thermophilic serine proteinase [Acaryochloris thomasi RCC1774]|uniref:Thermophilic serine proteinase n=1 Tax=Acaryochloris thomasi RCC1774 TaxID=1764569 RepID=A0A2W1JSR2_9CYAN|nr:DUF5942 domain-containing protein [Acaryochloris thomasi]PZD72944.1 Thermophilic serine proteinase [Acaryochloris thomasi RCC1774]